jgi:hypothetical protein
MQVPRLQVVPSAQNPHESCRPQPSLAVPHTFVPHACAAVQQLLPQVIQAPQPSKAVPQALPPHAWAGLRAAQTCHVATDIGWSLTGFDTMLFCCKVEPPDTGIE